MKTLTSLIMMLLLFAPIVEASTFIPFEGPERFFNTEAELVKILIEEYSNDLASNQAFMMVKDPSPGGKTLGSLLANAQNDVRIYGKDLLTKMHASIPDLQESSEFDEVMQVHPAHQVFVVEINLPALDIVAVYNVQGEKLVDARGQGAFKRLT